MTSTTGSTAHSSATLGAAGGIAVRSLRNIRRLPSAFLPALLMPLFQLISFSGTYEGATKIPGFPTDNSVNWYLPLAGVMGCSFAGLGVGFTMIRDVESGFYDRLRMAPAPRRSLLVGPLLASWVRSLLVITLVLAIGFTIGATLPGGVLGIATLYAAGVGITTIGTGWGLGLAYRFRDMRAAAIMQLTLFFGLFLTNAQTPLDVMEGWLHDVARVNPLTNVLRLGRQGFIGDVTWNSTWGGLLALVVIGGLAMWFAATGLNGLDD